MPNNKGPARYGSQRHVYDRNKKIILSTQSICYLCGKPVNFDAKPPDYYSPSIDHFIPLSKGGTNDIDNLFLAHLGCNLNKGDKLYKGSGKEQQFRKQTISNRNLPQSYDWSQ